MRWLFLVLAAAGFFAGGCTTGDREFVRNHVVLAPAPGAMNSTAAHLLPATPTVGPQ